MLVAGPVAAQLGLQVPILIDVGLAVIGLAMTFTLVEPPRDSSVERESMVATTRAAAKHVARSPVLLAAFAVGAALAASLPHTDMEDDLLGDPSDDLKEKAGEQAEHAYDGAKERVSEVYSKVTEAVAPHREGG